MDDAKLETFQADPYVAALASYCSTETPGAVLLHQTQEVRLTAPRLAGRLGTAVVMNGVAVESTGDGLSVTTTAFGGDTRAIYDIKSAGCSIIAGRR